METPAQPVDRSLLDRSNADQSDIWARCRDSIPRLSEDMHSRQTSRRPSLNFPLASPPRVRPFTD